MEIAVRSLLAPRICAASSYEASTDCRALDASRIHVGKRMQHRDENEARHREDVEGQPRQAGHVAHEHVDEPGIRAEQVDEGDGGQKRRREVRQAGGELQQPLAGHIGAADRERHQHADQEAEQAGPGAEDERVLERLQVEASGQHLAEMIEAQSPFAAHAADEQRQQRQHHQDHERRDGSAHDHVLEPRPHAKGRTPRAGLQRDIRGSRAWMDGGAAHVRAQGGALPSGLVVAAINQIAARTVNKRKIAAAGGARP